MQAPSPGKRAQGPSLCLFFQGLTCVEHSSSPAPLGALRKPCGWLSQAAAKPQACSHRTSSKALFTAGHSGPCCEHRAPHSTLPTCAQDSPSHTKPPPPAVQALRSALASCDLLSASHPPHEKHPHFTDEETEADALPKILQQCSAHAPLLRCPLSSAALTGPGKRAKERLSPPSSL